MKILYIYHYDPESASVQSGRPYSILREMRRSGHDVTVLHIPLGIRHGLASKALSMVLRRAHRRDREPSFWRHFASVVYKKLYREGMCYDLIFSPSTLPFAFLKTGIPQLACVDTLFADYASSYPEMKDLPEPYLRNGEFLERLALKNISLLIVPSEQAADIAKTHYYLDPERVIKIPFGGNLGRQWTNKEIEQAIAQRSTLKPSFLFVGRDWQRKCGDLVVSVVASLCDRGVDASAHFVGVERPHTISNELLEKLHFYGEVSTATEKGAECLYQISCLCNFFFVPSRAEAFGMAFVEAASLGLPLIGRDVGGIRETITPGNGYLIKSTDTTEEITNFIVNSSDPATYWRLAAESRKQASEKLSWERFWEEVTLQFGRLRQRRGWA